MTGDSEAIATGVATGLSRSLVRLTDRRLLVIYLMLAAFVAVVLTRQDHQLQQDRRNLDQVNSVQRAAYDNCVKQTLAYAKFNDLLDQLVTNATNTRGLTPAQKAGALDRYADMHMPILDCSQLAGAS